MQDCAGKRDQDKAGGEGADRQERGCQQGLESAKQERIPSLVGTHGSITLTVGKFLQLREGCGSRKPLPRLSAGTSASSGEERCLGSPGLYPHHLGSKMGQDSGLGGGRVRNPDSVSAASTCLADQGVRVGCCPLPPRRPSSPKRWFAELLSQLLPDKVDS